MNSPCALQFPPAPADLILTVTESPYNEIGSVVRVEATGDRVTETTREGDLSLLLYNAYGGYNRVEIYAANEVDDAYVFYYEPIYGLRGGYNADNYDTYVYVTDVPEGQNLIVSVNGGEVSRRPLVPTPVRPSTHAIREAQQVGDNVSLTNVSLTMSHEHETCVAACASINRVHQCVEFFFNHMQHWRKAKPTRPERHPPVCSTVWRHAAADSAPMCGSTAVPVKFGKR